MGKSNGEPKKRTKSKNGKQKKYSPRGREIKANRKYKGTTTDDGNGENCVKKQVYNGLLVEDEEKRTNESSSSGSGSSNSDEDSEVISSSEDEDTTNPKKTDSGRERSQDSNKQGNIFFTFRHVNSPITNALT